MGMFMNSSGKPLLRGAVGEIDRIKLFSAVVQRALLCSSLRCILDLYTRIGNVAFRRSACRLPHHSKRLQRSHHGGAVPVVSAGLCYASSGQRLCLGWCSKHWMHWFLGPLAKKHLF